MAATCMQFQVGGTLRADDPTYIERQADHDLYTALCQGQLCYVLTSRQMGKSSLLVRARLRLTQAGYRCLALDLTSLGTQHITPSQWYKSLCVQLWLGFELGTLDQFQAYWQTLAGDSLQHRVIQCLRRVLQHYPEQPVIILVDEIDSILALEFSADDFFALIRFCHNQRSLEPEWQRLTFALFGVTTPTDLIRDSSKTVLRNHRQRTSFSLGRAISLEGFSLAEAQPLAAGLGLPPELAEATLEAILYWTGGQPFLTQKFCQRVCEELYHQGDGAKPTGKDDLVAWVNRWVMLRLVQNWESQDDPEHLRTIRDRLRRDPDQSGGRLGLYQRILEADLEPGNGSTLVVADDSPDQAELLLSGLVVRRQGYLVVKNPFYQAVFNRHWVAEQLAALRPYSAPLATQ